jgi:hypothetical protein
MKKTLIKSLAGLMLIAAFGISITGCQKEHNLGYTSKAAEDQDPINSIGANAFAPVACSANIPDSLKVPAGNKLVLQTFANGVQIYQLKRSTTFPSTLTWVNIAPSASLYAKPDFTNQIGIHYGGPSWQFTKGAFKDEKVVAKKLKGSVQDPSAIPWLLLEAVDSLSSAGNRITYIHRLCTTGGLEPPPPVASDEEGRIDSIPYTAVYLFYARN